jgi:hypothetical protein
LVACIVVEIVTYSSFIEFDIGALIDINTIILIFICAIWARRDFDVVSALAIVLVAQVVSEVAFHIYSYNIAWVILCYSLAALSIYFCWHDNLSKLMLLAFVAAICLEVFWLVSGYEKKPQVSWYFLIVAINLSQRELITLRPFLLMKKTKYPAKEILLDYLLRITCGFTLMIEFLNITEYLIRHSTNFKPVTIYHLYPYLTHFVSALIVLAVVIFTYKTERNRQLLA